MNRASAPARQRGGFLIGAIVGLLFGLTVALLVALYVTKAPIPFINKVPARPATQDAAETERNRNWDPNSALAGRTPAPVSTGPATAASALLPSTPLPTPSVVMVTPPTTIPVPAPTSTARDAAPAATRASQPLTPMGGTSTYFVQAGAFARSEDAEQQRARLALLGVESRLTEREQAGRMVYRVRVGPFDRKEDADSAKERLADSGVDSAIVAVTR